MITLTDKQIAEFNALYDELFPAAKNAQIEGMITLGHNQEPAWEQKRNDLMSDIVANLYMILHPDGE